MLDTSRKTFLRELVLVGGPIALQNFFLNGLNMVDSLMVGQLGETALGAVNLGNQLYFIYMLLGFGIASGTTVFTARYWGRGDRQSISRAFSLGTITLGIGSFVFAFLSLVIPEQILGLYSKDQEVVALGADYLRIVGWSYPFIGLSNLTAGVLRSTRDVKTPLIASSVALVVNTIGNAICIYGLGPIPAMGVEGAALATVASRILELGLIVALAGRKKDTILHQLWPQPKAIIPHRIPQKREFFGKTIPIIGNEILWATGYTMYALVFGRMGTESLAAYSILEAVVKLSLVFFIGTANAGAIILGNLLGEGKDDLAQVWAKRLLTLIPLGSLGISLIIAASAWVVPLAFNVAQETRNVATGLLLVYSLVLPFKILNIQALVSVLRAGGDTWFSLVVDAGTLWLIGVPAAALMGLAWGIPAHLVFLAALAEEAFKAIFMYQRTISGRWNHRLGI